MVPSKFIRSNAGRCLPVLLAALIFSGCSLQPPDKSGTLLQGKMQANSAYYLQQMQQNADDSKTTWQLLAVRALLKEGQIQKADEIYRQLPGQLTQAQHQEALLLSAEFAVINRDPVTVEDRLGKLDPESLSPEQRARYWQARINAAQGKPSLALLRALIAQEPLLPAADRQKNIDATWNTLATMTPAQVNALVINADENILQGWIDLQQTWSSQRGEPQQLKFAITDWRTRYPNNPGAKMLPTALKNIQNFTPSSTDKIALMLPLNGQAAVFGRAIQQGFEAAKNMGVVPVVPAGGAAAPAQEGQATDIDNAAGTDSNDGAATPNDDIVSPSSADTDALTGEQKAAATQETVAQPQPQPAAPIADAAQAKPAAQITVYDTSTQPIEQLLAKEQQEGASIVVGPLLKNNVDGMLGSGTPLNVLALNQPEHISGRANVCYFALSPEDEARDAAAHIWQEGHRAPLLLVPRSALGDRVTKAFSEAWRDQGGGAVLQQKFGSENELRQGINGGGIALSGTPVNDMPAQSADNGLDQQSPDAIAQNQGGVDAVYILATRAEIALIKPMIAMRAGSRGSAALYASSRSAQGSGGTDFRLEMEGLQFSEIPMLAGGNPQLMQQALGASHNDYTLARLYAMGVDAWALASHFTQMRQEPGYQISGNTGTLTASPDCVISRKMSWLKYQQGQVVPVM